MHLRRMERCTIIPPDWMNVHHLEHVKSTERESELFTRMPSEYYMETAKILLLNAPQDIPDATEIKTLIKVTLLR
jgi:GINS complex subunit 2